ncbi:hypothetical protein T613_02839 [Mycobacterium tuberculosis UT0097]|uniref:hypothetical protein n=1 Tax=Mycobacterium tuberculosis TaxID=1773 RepID=UPI000459DC85|nr:hypothetical protein [Mycobacterium tuberculosis]KAL44472.1 hypothetical protein Z536_00477 [Mycobacterium tuberculosis UT0043]KBK33126.1 hypothetical protein T572_02137 [Mycobacterium tuberculosis UT0034]KBL79217.1 hypothetical protein T613_02839 [Mycobacterium tuberculosis UT0097]
MMMNWRQTNITTKRCAQTRASSSASEFCGIFAAPGLMRNCHHGGSAPSAVGGSAVQLTVAYGPQRFHGRCASNSSVRPLTTGGSWTPTSISSTDGGKAQGHDTHDRQISRRTVCQAASILASILLETVAGPGEGIGPTTSVSLRAADARHTREGLQGR